MYACCAWERETFQERGQTVRWQKWRLRDGTLLECNDSCHASKKPWWWYTFQRIQIEGRPWPSKVLIFSASDRTCHLGFGLPSFSQAATQHFLNNLCGYNHITRDGLLIDKKSKSKIIKGIPCPPYSIFKIPLLKSVDL